MLWHDWVNVFSCGAASGVCSSLTLAEMSYFGNVMPFCVAWGWGMPVVGASEKPTLSSGSPKALPCLCSLGMIVIHLAWTAHRLVLVS